MMFMMIGHVTEVLGGDTWQNLVTSKLFQPIGMNSSRFISEPDDTEAPHVARPYIFRDGEFQNGTKIIYEYVFLLSSGKERFGKSLLQFCHIRNNIRRLSNTETLLQ